MLQTSEYFIQLRHDLFGPHNSNERALIVRGRVHYSTGATPRNTPRRPRARLRGRTGGAHLPRRLYRLAGTQSRETDALAAIWKLTDPARFTWERQAEWDGVTVGGTTAASLQGIGDFFASPYRIYAPSRINSRLEAAAFAARAINAEDVSWEQGLPLTRPERTLIDLCLDSEDPSLIADAYRDARDIGLDYERLGKLVRETSATPKREKALEPLAELMRAIPKGDR